MLQVDGVQQLVIADRPMLAQLNLRCNNFSDPESGCVCAKVQSAILCILMSAWPLLRVFLDKDASLQAKPVDDWLSSKKSKQESSSLWYRS